jgi:GrpB-like predicted nucleotidyltransferase (UPF0157 family)
VRIESGFQNTPLAYPAVEEHRPVTREPSYRQLVQLTPYDPCWVRLYEGEVDGLVVALAPVAAVEHVGSTSVPGLAAKPTVDIAVGVPTLDLPEGATLAMEQLGYHYGGDLGLPQHVFRKGEQAPWRAIVHVVEHGGAMWRDYLSFRDHLRANPDDAARYEALKRSLLVGRVGWYSGRDKEAFIRPILNSTAHPHA